MSLRGSSVVRRAGTAVVTAAVLGAGLVVVNVTPAAAKVPSGKDAIGDSVMLGAAGALKNRDFRVNASSSRQVADGLSILRLKQRRGSLRANVVVHLGTNGTFTYRQCKAMHRTVGKNRRLFVMTVKVPRSWQKSNNRVIERCARQFDNVYLIDWRRFVDRHPGVVYADGYHLTPRGGRSYARLVDDRVAAVRSRVS